MGKYSKVALLGFLNQYSKAEMFVKLSDYQIEVLRSSDEGELIRFSGESIRIDLVYDMQGKFIRIHEEAWEKPTMLFKRKKN